VSDSISFKSVWLFSMALMLLPGGVQSQNYYDQHAIGWHWYDDPRVDEKSEDNHSRQPDPVSRIKAVRYALEIALDDALLNPTPQHVQQYITLQNQWSERASQFSRMWQWVLLQHPQLDYAITHPTNQVGRSVYLDILSQSQETAIKTLAQRNGLFFFYRSNCPYCQRFAPIVKSFSERYHMPVVPITIDGRVLPEFPKSRLDQGHAEQFHVNVEPALFTVNPYTRQAIPVAYGLISESDLRQRILDLAIASRRKSL
jgi:conjugal transfer pilus assembly protein TraF